MRRIVYGECVWTLCLDRRPWFIYTFKGYVTQGLGYSTRNGTDGTLVTVVGSIPGGPVYFLKVLDKKTRIYVRSRFSTFCVSGILNLKVLMCTVYK